MDVARRKASAFALFVIGAASALGCRSPMQPLVSTTIIGEFGGDQALLMASADHATLNLSCGIVTISTPLVTDATGRFSAAGSRRRVGGAPPIEGEMPTPVTVSGRAFTAGGGFIQFILAGTSEEPGAPPARADTLDLVRGRKASFVLCP